MSNNGSVKISVKRRTNLSDARKSAIIKKMLVFYRKLADELGESPETIDLALTTCARLAAQATFAGLDYTFPTPTDTVEVIEQKSRQFLLEVNPDVVARAEDLLREADATWNDPALLPTPPETDEKNS